MQNNPQYDDVVVEVSDFLVRQVNRLASSGVASNRICIDPGFGFGKTLDDNLTLLKNLDVVRKRLDLPVLAGLSCKSVVGALTGKPVGERLAGNLAIALSVVSHGASILRVHEVGETVDALKVWLATQ